jgi:hypothetical protein
MLGLRTTIMVLVLGAPATTRKKTAGGDLRLR